MMVSLQTVTDWRCLFYSMPVEIETGEVFAKPVGIVGGFPILARGGEQFAAGVGKRGGFPTHLDDESQLCLIKQIELFLRFVAEHFR